MNAAPNTLTRTNLVDTTNLERVNLRATLFNASSYCTFAIIGFDKNKAYIASIGTGDLNQAVEVSYCCIFV